MTEFKADVDTGQYPGLEHIVPIADGEFDSFAKMVKAQDA